MKSVAFVLIVAIVIGVGVFLSTRADAQYAEASRIQDCVVAEARAQGYSGNPYSQEAWTLFASNCD